MIILCRRFASIYPPPRPRVSDISLNFLIRLYVAKYRVSNAFIFNACDAIVKNKIYFVITRGDNSTNY